MNRYSKNSWLITAVLLLLGFLFLHFKIVDYGVTFFCLFPLAVGFSIGTIEKRKRQWYYILLGTFVFFGFLFASALEGLICVLMALPLFLLMVWLGYKAQARYMKDNPSDSHKVLITVFPLVLLLLVNPIERAITPSPQLVTISNSVILDYDADLVFDQVKQMSKLDAEKSIAMHLGLPSPQRCILEADTIGAKRHCIFDSGEITAVITKYKKGEILEMAVTDYTLTGKDWFQFENASYTFEEIDGKTKITRHSAYRSVLHPRLYWEPLEKWGIEQEHNFVLSSLKKNLSELE